MFSDTPSFATEEVNQDPARTWCLYVFQVAGHTAQQRILSALLELELDGVTGLGTHRGSEHFVIVDYSTATDKAQAKQVVLAVDPDAVVTFSGRKRQIGRDV